MVVIDPAPNPWLALAELIVRAVVVLGVILVPIALMVGTDRIGRLSRRPPAGRR